MSARFRLTSLDALTVEPRPFGVEAFRDDDGDLMVRLWRRWRVGRVDLRVTLADGEGPLYYQSRYFGPFTITRLPLARR